MVGWVEPLAGPAERFVRAAVQDVLGYHCTVVAMVVALLGVPSVYLRVLALEGFVADLLAVVVLLWSYPTFEDSCVS